MQVTSFGHMDGVEIFEITLNAASGATASVISFGAVVRDLIVPSSTGPQRVVLGLDCLDDYRRHSPHFGAVPGRFANRIAKGRFSLDGKAYQLPLNEGGRTTLHGGHNGFGVRPWMLGAVEPNAVTLTLDSPDGDEGFPGAMRVSCTYRLLEPATLFVELVATCDAPTIVNLAQHSYFNLDGSADVLDHEVMIAAGLRTQTDPTLIPTGEIVSVVGTPWDFRTSRPIRNASGTAYDTNYVIDLVPDRESGMAHVATVRSPKNGLALEVHTDQAGLQFYDANMLECPVPGLGGAHYGRHAGFCFEAQAFPDAPNHRHFPSAVLRPGETYRQRTDYRFIA